MKIDIISGFLGAGKTTLIKKFISEAFSGEKTVLIENEFGEIGVDGGFLKEAGIDIKEMNSGCICCSLVGDFEASLKEVIEKYSPERIIIEPSGVGKLSDVVKAVEGVVSDAEIVVNNKIAVVNAQKAPMYIKNFGEFFVNQVTHASAVVLSRTSDMSEDKINEVVKQLREYNKEAVMIITPWEVLDGKVMLSIIESNKSFEKELLDEVKHHHHHNHDDECGCGEHHGHHHHHDHDEECGGGEHHGHHHHADDVFTSWGKETAKKYSIEEIKEKLAQLGNEEEYGFVLRAKGILDGVNGEWIYFDLVPGEIEVRVGAPSNIGKVCVIGSKIDEEKIAKLF